MPTGLVSSYDLTVGVKVNMDEAIYVLSPLDSPMLTGMDADGLSVIGSAPVDEVQFDWMDEQLLIPRSTLGAGLVTAATTMTLASANDRLKFSTGDAIRLVLGTGASDEIVRVTGYSVTTSTDLLITRALVGTALGTYTTGAPVIGLGTSLAEGSDPEAARSQDRVANTNVTQIFGPTLVHLSETEKLVAKYGVSNEMARQLYNRTRENAIQREQAFVYGARYNSTTTEIRTTGGLNYFITTNHDSTSTNLTVATIQGLQQDAFDQGGVWDRLMTNPKALETLNDPANTTHIRTELTDSKRGRVPTMQLFTEFGPVLVVRNRWVHQGHAFGFSRENVIRRVLRPLTAESLAKTGDSTKLQIVCEEGLEVKGEEHMGKFTALNYAA
jgi:hypothetical protein